jgi:hypothetical protein
MIQTLLPGTREKPSPTAYVRDPVMAPWSKFGFTDFGPCWGKSGSPVPVGGVLPPPVSLPPPTVPVLPAARAPWGRPIAHARPKASASTKVHHRFLVNRLMKPFLFPVEKLFLLRGLK